DNAYAFFASPAAAGIVNAATGEKKPVPWACRYLATLAIPELRVEPRRRNSLQQCKQRMVECQSVGIGLPVYQAQREFLDAKGSHWSDSSVLQSMEIANGPGNSAGRGPEGLGEAAMQTTVPPLDVEGDLMDCPHHLRATLECQECLGQLLVDATVE